MIDSVLWSGESADLSNLSEDTVVLRNLNAKAATDPRINHRMLPIADGLTLVRKI
jgi:predicted O-methyltransferase YrrM